ncbi:MAG: hypothetical protein ACOVOX_15175 [Burkholderiaceae bacterium]
MATNELIALAVVFLGLFAFTWVASRVDRLLKRKMDAPGAVTFNESFVQYTPPNSAEVRRVLWEELLEVGILTTDSGPVVDDVFWMLVDGDEKGCLIPSETKGMGELIKRLQTLPDFDNTSLINAMASSANAKFVCWVRA